jgi:hypothetical protein
MDQQRNVASIRCIALTITLVLSGCLERELKPLNPCLVSGVVAEVEVANVDKIDLLFMVDNSHSMLDEQNSLAREIPDLIRILTSGDRDLDGEQDFPPAKDLHIGVISSDLGLPGVSDYEGCSGLGDNGELRSMPSTTDDPSCSATQLSPPFLTYNKANGDDAEKLIQDFACIAKLGTGGCGFEQQLESALKAVWPGNDSVVKFVTDPTGKGSSGNAGPGFANGDFIRNDPNEGPSLIAIVLVTDEEDCSSNNLGHFPLRASEHGPNTRCFFEGQRPEPNNLFDVQRYIDTFKALRRGQEQLVIFAGIVGVPERLVTKEAMGAYDRKDRAQSDAFFDSLLNDPDMQERIDARNPNDPTDDNIVPSCKGGDLANAYPPRRIVQVAKGFGANGVIQSICQDNFAPAMDAIIKTIAEQLPDVCLPRPLVRSSDGMVECNVIWELPREPMGTTPTRCDERSYLSPPDSNRSAKGKSGGAACKVTQLPVIGMAEPTGTDGWFYDDFSEDTLAQCTLYPDKQRITFTPGATPPSGVLVKLECLNETQSLPNTRTDLQQNIEQPAVGDGCDMVMLRGREVSNDDACVVLLAEPVNGSNEDRSLFCHLESRVCVQRCSTSAECPAAWVCDTNADSIARAGHAYCVNPTCGSGGD